MAHVFVTGASGFIGSLLVQELLDRGHRVHALCRGGRPAVPPIQLCQQRTAFDHPHFKPFEGDITRPASVRRAMAGCTQVYHLAGYAKNWARRWQTYFDVNVEGACNVFEAARQIGVERVVWTSTMLTFGPTRPGEIGDEQSPRTTPKHITHYEASKAMAESRAAEYAADGLPLVIVNPGRVFGPGHLTEGNSLSKIIDMYDRGQMPVLLGGERVGNFVAVDDVVQGHLLAMQHGRSGEKYLLGGENLSLRAFFQLVDQVSGKRHFQIPIRRPAAMAYAWMQLARARLLGIYPQITPSWVRVFLLDWAYSSAKAERELGYRPTPIVEAVDQTYRWLRKARREPHDGRLRGVDGELVAT